MLTEQRAGAFAGTLILSVLCLPCSSVLHAAPEAYLRANDHIVFIGDSITEGGIYGEMVDVALKATYPDAGLQAVSHGSGGKTAAAGTGLLSHYLSSGKPTIVAVMFGANDTGWSAGGAAEKAAAFTNNLRSIVSLCREHTLDVVLIRTSHFSHSTKPDTWVDGINGTLQALLAAQDAFAKDEQIPVIDGYGAYTNALRGAWNVDPLYEFTPDVIHPLEAGAAALAAGILDGLGVGLPLCGEKRGAMHASATDRLRIEVENGHGVSAVDGTIDLALTVRNESGNEIDGSVVCTAGTWSESRGIVRVPANGKTVVRFTIRAASLQGRYSCAPVHALFSTDAGATSAQNLFQHSRILDLSQTAFAAPGAGFTAVQAPPDTTCPVRLATVNTTAESITVSLDWQDDTIVPAEAGFKSRFGQIVETPLNLNSRPGDQRYDAVELLLDLRPEKSTARYTSGSDGNPDGLVRIGVYRKTADGEAAVTVHPAAAAKDVALAQEKSGRMSITLKQSLPTHFGFAVLVTDTTAPGKVKSVHYLGGDHPLDPMGQIRMSGTSGGIFWRVGY